ncbi:uncharacterized protein LOC119108482 [Pollicipes pollicipes]|uniref:uncharacterized protein LOC119108482 n=1 Tax=Pollicipes pollicipes TaxID=41117 RepID=UPI0018858389|nr:uncharacterized protein LOC119108482 [Pollicipes pollicipes]
MPDIEEDTKRVIVTFFAPPLSDKDSKNENLRNKVKLSGRFEKGGTIFRIREVYDTYRNGGAFPMFHYQDDPTIVRSLMDDHSKMFPKYALGDGMETRQGIYQEVARKRLSAYDPHCRFDDLSYITLAYKSLEPEPNQKLLDNWKSWTGARSIMEDFGGKVPVQEVIFLAREHPFDFSVFAYIVLMSFQPSEEVRPWVLYYIQKLRVERWFGYITLYAAAPSFKNSAAGSIDA